MQDKSTLDTLLKARRLKKGNDVCSSSKLYLSVKTTSFFLLYSISKCSKRLHLHIKITTFFLLGKECLQNPHILDYSFVSCDLFL